MTEAATLTIDALNALLDREQAALLAGDLGALEPIAEEKEQLLAELRDVEIDARDELQRLHDQLDRNRDLLLGAMEGIRSVVDRIRELRQLRRSLDTYNKEGLRQSLATERDHQLERRA